MKDKITDLDKLTKGQVTSFKNSLDRIMDSFPKVPEPFNAIDLTKIKLKNQIDTDISYDENRGLLMLRGESIKFTVDRKIADVLKTIFSESLSKEWSWDEIIENWEEEKSDYGTPGGAQVMIYNTGKNINKRVAAETGNKSFLIVTYKKMKINPKYLK
jgi:hypothetical protein